MESLPQYLESQRALGRATFTTEAARSATGLSPAAVKSALARLTRKHAVVAARRGFYLILRPEDRLLGAPDPTTWIDPLMRFLQLDYRVSLLRAAAFHGASHQAAMVFQVVAPRQLRPITIGRQRLEFLYQSAEAFRAINQPAWLVPLKTASGFTQMAGVELTLLDCCRYFHRAGGINGVAQAVLELGRQARPRVLAVAATGYENAAVRRLGYLLDHFGHARQAAALRPAVKHAKSFKPLDPSLKAVARELAVTADRNDTWKLIVNLPIEVDR